MSIIRIATRYAKSLIELASEQGKLDQVVQDMDLFRKSLESRDLYLMLKSPIIHKSKKSEILKVLFKDRVDPLTLSFFDIIVRKGREEYLPEITENFEAQYKKIKNISTVKLTTASELDPSVLDRITKILESSDETDQHVEIVTEVNPDLIGGYVIEIGDKQYDASVLNKLEEYKKSFLGNDFVRSN